MAALELSLYFCYNILDYRKGVLRMHLNEYIDADLLNRFEFFNYNHALEIITQAFPEEWEEIVRCLRNLHISVQDLR